MKTKLVLKIYNKKKRANTSTVTDEGGVHECNISACFDWKFTTLNQLSDSKYELSGLHKRSTGFDP